MSTTQPTLRTTVNIHFIFHVNDPAYAKHDRKYPFHIPYQRSSIQHERRWTFISHSISTVEFTPHTTVNIYSIFHIKGTAHATHDRQHPFRNSISTTQHMPATIVNIHQILPLKRTGIRHARLLTSIQHSISAVQHRPRTTMNIHSTFHVNGPCTPRTTVNINSSFHVSGTAYAELDRKRPFQFPC